MIKSAYGISEIVTLVPVGRTFIYGEINSGRLKAVKAGRRTLVRDEDLRAWLSTCEAKPRTDSE